MSIPRERHVTREAAIGSVGPGWQPLINQVYDEIALAADPDFFITQVKEKFGELRIYESFEHPVLGKTISRAMLASSQICEDCGHLGQANPSGRGWIRTSCLRHDPDLFNEPLETEEINEFPAKAISPDELMNTDPDKWGPFLSSPNALPETLSRAWQWISSPQRPANFYIEPHYHYLALNPNTPKEVLAPMAGVCHDAVLSRMASRKDIAEIESIVLSADPPRYVLCCLAKNPSISESAIADLYKSPYQEVRDAALRNSSCPQGILAEAALISDLAPEIILNPSASPKMLEALLLAISYSDAYSAAAANKIISRLKTEIKNGHRVSKASLAWLMRHPDKDIRLQSAALSSQNYSKPSLGHSA